MLDLVLLRCAILHCQHRRKYTAKDAKMPGLGHAYFETTLRAMLYTLQDPTSRQALCRQETFLSCIQHCSQAILGVLSDFSADMHVGQLVAQSQ